MTVGELKKELDGLPDDTLVGSSGHYGEYLEVNYTSIGEVSIDWQKFNEKKVPIFIISIMDAGEEPD
jgi:hypothetical protein